MKFSFVGEVPSSKSLFNRALILKSFEDNLLINGFSQCDDVALMKKALKDFSEGKTELYCGSAGTVLRFLAIRVSKKPGKYYLKADEQLLNRPQKELIKLLSQLSCQAVFDKKGLHITSLGWSLMGDSLSISAKQSSQFVSAFLLNAWNLTAPCYISLGDTLLSKTYLQMTIKLCQQQGMSINYSNEKPYEIYIPKQQQVNATPVFLEPDMSSVFALAAIASVSGHAQITKFPVKSLQGDSVFIPYLKEVGANIHTKMEGEGVVTLQVKEASVFKTPFCGHKMTKKLEKAFEVSLKNTPDLFPVLAALACLLTGESVFHDTAHIAYKESNRLKEMKTLLNLLGREVDLKQNTFVVKKWQSLKASPALKKNIIFDTKKDHRLVMAAYVLKTAGFSITCSNEEAVSKSFPEFLPLTKGPLSYF
ncbi:MAG: hypothetical protein HAW63_05485 [Bdellovibrionaceae bacterium]|nr:hypothetical protein [Pseudobdellovibrionaceae bacterium]